MQPEPHHSYLRRLPAEFYQGTAYVHWSMSIEDRKTGWLDDSVHLWFRDIHAHVLHRYNLACPVYCLMPEHAHLFWIGLGPTSDQRKAAKFFRSHFNGVLRAVGAEFQNQAHDNVLRENDRERDAVVRLAYYIAENPVRANLVKDARKWPYSGSHAIGYPDMDWRMDAFAERFWTVFSLEVKKRQ